MQPPGCVPVRRMTRSVVSLIRSVGRGLCGAAHRPHSCIVAGAGRHRAGAGLMRRVGLEVEARRVRVGAERCARGEAVRHVEAGAGAAGQSRTAAGDELADAALRRP
jgi:hypothetical protein